MIKSFRGIHPQVAATAFVSETGLIIGNVVLLDHAGVWPGAVVRGDFARITIGEYSIIEDNVVVHSGSDITFGSHVIVGHGAVVHCNEIGNNTLIANNATVLDNAVVGSYCIIGAGCVVSPNSRIPDRSLVFGVPGRVVGEVKQHQMARLERGNFSYVGMYEQYRKDGI